MGRRSVSAAERQKERYLPVFTPLTVKCTRGLEHLACQNCTKRGYSLRECGRSIFPHDDPTPRRAGQKLSTYDPAEIELVRNHRARLAIPHTQLDITPQEEEETTWLEFTGVVQNASLSQDTSNREPPSSNEEVMLRVVVDAAESGGSSDLISEDELEAYFSLFLN